METKCISRGKNAAPISFKLHRIVPLTTTTYQIFHTFLTYPQFSIITQIILLRMKTLLDFLCVIFEGFSKSCSYSVKLYYFHLVMKIHWTLEIDCLFLTATFGMSILNQNLNPSESMDELYGSEKSYKVWFEIDKKTQLK